MKKPIRQMISADDLFVDECNMRKDVFAYDEDMIYSIEIEGVREALIVRPLPSGFWEDWDEKFGIVCGAQRYRAGLESSPPVEEFDCVVKEMTDAEARLESMRENYNRYNPPWYEFVEPIGQSHEDHREAGLTYTEIVREISKGLGMREFNVVEFLLIRHLPEEIRLLFKDGKQRSKGETEKLRSVGITSTKSIGRGKAQLLAILERDLRNYRIDTRKYLIAFTRRFLLKPEAFWKKAIGMIRENHDINFDEIERKISGDPNRTTVNSTIDLDLFEELKNICERRNKTMSELIEWILGLWVERWDVFY